MREEWSRWRRACEEFEPAGDAPDLRFIGNDCGGNDKRHWQRMGRNRGHVCVRRDADQTWSAGIPGKSTVGVHVDRLNGCEYQDQYEAKARYPAIETSRAELVFISYSPPVSRQILTLGLERRQLTKVITLIPKQFASFSGCLG